MKTAISLILNMMLVLILLTGTSFADPVINGVTGSLLHGETITITGSGYGIKDPAMPLVWDNGSESRPLDDFYSETLPSSAQQGAYYNMSYRQLPFRNVSAPNVRITHSLAGAHATDNSSGQYYSGNNVSLLVPMTSFNYFAQYWYRLDPLFDDSNHPSQGDNMKELCLSGSDSQIYGGVWGYFGWCGNTVPDSSNVGPVRLARNPGACNSLPYACSQDDNVVYHENPIGGWKKFQWEGTYDTTFDNPNVRLTTYPDGQATFLDHYGNGITTYETLYGCGTPHAGGMRGLGIGGFSRVPRVSNGANSFRYFTGIYVDDTLARVMLGDNQEYDDCTILEPQIPQTWSGTSIEVEMNLGSLHEGATAYLFVFDEANNRNATGYAIDLGGEYTGDDIAPMPPVLQEP